jgi:UDP-N-acetylmuramoyl-tripeptide--D-alanyl-D-alanine ligase
MEGLNDLFVSEALRGALLSKEGSGGDFTKVVIDSRRVSTGSIFIAIPGDRVDGHSYIEAAQIAGARGIICHADWTVHPHAGVTFYRVNDTLAAFRQLASAWRSKVSQPVLAVAGSVGKTTTKEMLAALLRGRFATVGATQGSENGFVGIPLTMLRYQHNTGAFVIEVGIDEPGAMAQHMEVVRPSGGIVTAIEPEHLEKLGDLATVAREEALCLRWLAKSHGILAINCDDPWLAPLLDQLVSPKGKIVSYSLEERLPASDTHLAGQCAADAMLSVSGLGLHDVTMKVPLPGMHNARNLLGAVALARAVGLSAEEILRGLDSFVPPEGRSLAKQIPGGPLVHCDYYNASPASMAASFQTAALFQRGAGGQLIACLGDMLELGHLEESYHRALARDLIDLNYDAVYCAGHRMEWLKDELKKQEYRGILLWYPDSILLASDVAPKIRPADVVLVKGSRGMNMERVWHALSSRFGTEPNKT